MYSYGEGSSTGRPYQGFPYVNPAVVDAPSIDAETASRWAHLPRRPAYMQTSAARAQPNISIGAQQQASSSKLDPDSNPVVYIDMPATNGSDVAEPRTAGSEDEAFVQETIFYDQFKDRRLELDRSDSEGGSSAACGSPQPLHIPRPTPPDTLSLNSPNRGPNAAFASNIPPSLAKEASVYGSIRSPEEVFPTSADSFPEPPPAYTERDSSVHGSAMTPGSVLSPTTEGSTLSPSIPEQPRTQVITTGNRQFQKFLYCSYCGTRTHTLVIKQTGMVTHVVAGLLCLFGLLPLTILIYCTDLCKYHNHYCKQCNERIAYEIPTLCQELTYVSN